MPAQISAAFLEQLPSAPSPWVQLAGAAGEGGGQGLVDFSPDSLFGRHKTEGFLWSEQKRVFALKQVLDAKRVCYLETPSPREDWTGVSTIVINYHLAYEETRKWTGSLSNKIVVFQKGFVHQTMFHSTDGADPPPLGFNTPCTDMQGIELRHLLSPQTKMIFQGPPIFHWTEDRF